MNNEWLNNLRSRMENHEEEVPEGLWNDIRNELFSGEEENELITGFIPSIDAENKTTDIGNSEKKSWFYRIGSVAAAAALIFIMMKIWPEENKNTLSQNLSDSHKSAVPNLTAKKEKNQENTETKEQPKAQIPLVQKNFNTINSSVKNIKRIKSEEIKGQEAGPQRNSQIAVKKTEIMEPSVYEENTLKEIPLADDTRKNKEVEKEVNTIEKELREKYADHTKKQNVKAHSEKKWMLSMLTGNASSNSAEQQFHGYASVSGKPMSFEQAWSASEYIEDPLKQILLANQSKQVEARIRHKVPVTFGLSVYYNLGNKWGIGTGINYTKLSSELHSGSDDNYIKGEQKVQYIGIPVQVNYNVIQKGRFTGYITGGAMLEKPISGSVTTSYVVHDEVKETVKENIGNKPLSFSVNTAAGVQVKVVNRLGIYAEPGIGYHFKDEKSPNTIYKEKPLYFNVKFGIRLLID